MSSPQTGNPAARRVKRISIALPIRITGKDSSEVKWEEMSRTIDVSPFGIGFGLKRQVEAGRLLRLTLMMPQQMRSFDFMEPQYKVWSIVRTCVANTDKSLGESFLLGTALIGKKPPASFEENPSQIYKLTEDPENGQIHLETVGVSDAKSERVIVERLHSRYKIPVNIVVGVVDSKGDVSETETTVMENVSLGGAAIFSSLNLDVGSTVQITNEHYKANLTATVREKRTGDDGIPRLHIEFTNGQFPLPEIDG